MGGTRFKDAGPGVRVDRATHDAVAAQTIAALAGIGVTARTIPHLRAKADFGDVDLLCSSGDTHARLPARSEDTVRELTRRDAAVALALRAVDHHRGAIANPTLHLLVRGPTGPVQVDLTSIDAGLLDFATAQLSWGDAGSLAGVVARQMGLKMGMNGLALTAERGGRLLRSRIGITHAEALELTGHDPDVHAHGFDHVEEVYAWIAAGRYFDPRIWRFDRLNNKSRQRAVKRPGYVGFLAWMDETNPPARYDWGDGRGARIADWWMTLSERFDQAAADIAAQAARTRNDDGLRAFFTVDALIAATGAGRIADDRLKHVMNATRRMLGRDRLEAMAARNDRAGLADAMRVAAGADARREI